MNHRAWLTVWRCAAVAAAAAGCASTPSTNVALARLQTLSRTAPSVPVLRAMGIVHYEARRYPEARAVLDSAIRLDPTDATAALFLGLSSEQVGDVASARRAYARYIDRALTAKTRNLVAARLHSLTRREIEAGTRDALERQATISQLPPAPREVVAVLPCVVSPADPTIDPIGRGVAELLTADLGRLSAITLIDRESAQAMVTALQPSGPQAIDLPLAVRIGKLLRAGRVVQCAISAPPNRLVELRVSVLDVGLGALDGTVPSRSGRLDDLPTVTRTMVPPLLGLLEAPPAGRELEQMLADPVTRSANAFLTFSRGLLAEDEGRLADALILYHDARDMDPRFRNVQVRADRLEAASGGMLVTPTIISASLARTTEGAIASAALRGVALSVTSAGITLNTFLTRNTRELIGVQAATAATGGAATSPARDASATLATERVGSPPAGVTVVPPSPIP